MLGPVQSTFNSSFEKPRLSYWCNRWKSLPKRYSWRCHTRDFVTFVVVIYLLAFCDDLRNWISSVYKKKSNSLALCVGQDISYSSRRWNGRGFWMGAL